LFFVLRLVSKEFQHPEIQTKIAQHLGGFFHRIKVCQPMERQDSMQTVIGTSRRLDSFLHEAAQNF
jgi:translation initiation factor 2 beta subunit (eIF-2beta)/eIF-5